jgi:uncharacterized SAM-binding protein YcdF (DUF218 family)
VSAAINHFITGLVNPYCVVLIGIFAGALLAWRRWRRTAVAVTLAALAWAWVWSSGWMVWVMGRGLERDFPFVEVASFPEADAIIVLGGGMTINTNDYNRAEMWAAADRVWRGAQLYRAGKAKLVVCSGPLAGITTVPLLKDFGVPEEDIFLVEDAKNTEEESRMVGDLVRGFAAYRENRIEDVPAPTAFLVTSAWHERRALQLFAKNSGLRLIPAPADYEATVRFGPNHEWEIKDFLPNAEAMYMNGVFFKEYFAFYCYRWLKCYR